MISIEIFFHCYIYECCYLSLAEYYLENFHRSGQFILPQKKGGSAVISQLWTESESGAHQKFPPTSSTQRWLSKFSYLAFSRIQVPGTLFFFHLKKNQTPPNWTSYTCFWGESNFLCWFVFCFQPKKNANTDKKMVFLGASSHHPQSMETSHRLFGTLAPSNAERLESWANDNSARPGVAMFWDRVILNRVKFVWCKDRMCIYTIYKIYNICIYITFLEKKGWWSQNWLNDIKWLWLVGFLLPPSLKNIRTSNWIIYSKLWCFFGKHHLPTLRYRGTKKICFFWNSAVFTTSEKTLRRGLKNGNTQVASVSRKSLFLMASVLQKFQTSWFHLSKDSV